MQRNPATHGVPDEVVAVEVRRLLVDQGKAAYETPVGDIWPEFATAGKDATTVGMMLTHTSPVPRVAEPIRKGGLADWDYMTARVAAEPAAGRVRLELTLRSPVSGTMDVLDCRYFPRAGGPMLPAPESFDLAVVGFDSPLGDVALPRVEMSLAVPLGAETADAWK